MRVEKRGEVVLREGINGGRVFKIGEKNVVDNKSGVDFDISGV